MKKIITATILLSSSAFATTVDSHSMPVLGAQPTETFSLSTQTTRTLYRSETVARTCFRDVIDHYRTVCDQIVNNAERRPGDNHGQDPRPEPRDPRDRDGGERRPGDNHGQDPRPEPRPEPRRPVCHTEAVYRTEAYTCYQTVSVPYEVLDHNSISNFVVSLTNEGNANSGNQCYINFTMSGDNLSTGSNCSELLLLASKGASSSVDRFGTRVNNFDISVKAVDMNSQILALKGGLTNLHLEGQTLVVTTGDLNRATNAKLKLFVERRRFLKSDETLINRTLNAGEFTFESAGADTGLTKIDLRKLLGGINTSKKHKVRVELDVTLPAGEILNDNLMPRHQEAEITVWNN